MKHLPPRSVTRPPRQASLSLWLVALPLKLFLFCPDSVYPPGLDWRGGWVLSEGLSGREAPLSMLLKEAKESQPSEGKDFVCGQSASCTPCLGVKPPPTSHLK